MVIRLVALALVALMSIAAQAQNINESYSFAVLGEPKYATDFTQFDYVNPAAPKGGDITLSAIGTFDNFNRYASRGNPAVRSDQLYDSLFTTSDDEPGSYYPLIAEMARYPDNFAWAEVTINPKARFHDGTPITAEDVAFTFQKFMTEGVPQFRSIYKGASAKAISRLTVRFELATPSKERMLGLFSLPVMSKAFWQTRKFNEPLPHPPLGNGPYRISAWRMGQYVTYTRVKNYWAANLPVNRGRWNFDSIRYDYYLDDNVAFEAFKAGAYDFRNETNPKNWATRYTGSNFRDNYIVKVAQENTSAQDTRWLAFNIQRPIFADRQVREAISLAFDFEWMNKALFYGAYHRVNSYFQNTEYAASNYPNAAELILLAPYKAELPPQVFTSVYQPPASKGDGFDRDNILNALELLKSAGWVLKDKQLVNVKTGQPFTFELLLNSAGNNQWALPFQHNLARMGITMNIRQVDSSQLINRLRSRDYDMIPSLYSAMPWPSPSLEILWSTAYVNSTWNAPGVQNPIVDKLISQIVANQGNKEKLLPLGRALDRVLTWNYYMLPMWYMPMDTFAYWSKFSRRGIKPMYTLGFDNWWYDVNKAARLPAQRR